MAVQAPSVLTLALNFRVNEMTGDCFLAPWREMKEFKKNKKKKPKQAYESKTGFLLSRS